MTYGTKSALYLATQFLVELASTANSICAQQAIRNDFYVDDLLISGETDEDCFQLHKDIFNTLLAGPSSIEHFIL